MKATVTKVALPSAQGVRDPEREHSGWAPGGVFITLTSEAIRLTNGKRWLVLQDRYRQRRMERIRTEPTAEAIQEAFAVALGGSLAHRSYGRGSK